MDMNTHKQYSMRSSALNAVQSVDEVIARYSSLEQRRIALHKALRNQPNDPRLLQAIAKVTSPYQIRKAASSGLFISYARADEIFALELAVHLNDYGYTPWLDMVNGGNQDWTSEIHQAMRGCGVMLAVTSPAGLRDTSVRSERERFAGMGKLILPIISRPADLRKTNFWIAPIDFSKDFDFGLHQLQQVLSPETAAVS